MAAVIFCVLLILLSVAILIFNIVRQIKGRCDGNCSACHKGKNCKPHNCCTK